MQIHPQQEPKWPRSQNYSRRWERGQYELRVGMTLIEVAMSDKKSDFLSLLCYILSSSTITVSIMARLIYNKENEMKVKIKKEKRKKKKYFVWNWKKQKKETKLK